MCVRFCQDPLPELGHEAEQRHFLLPPNFTMQKFSTSWRFLGLVFRIGNGESSTIPPYSSGSIRYVHRAFNRLRGRGNLWHILAGMSKAGKTLMEISTQLHFASDFNPFSSLKDFHIIPPSSPHLHIPIPHPLIQDHRRTSFLEIQIDRELSSCDTSSSSVSITSTSLPSHCLHNNSSK